MTRESGETEALVSVSISQKGAKVAGMATSPDEFEKPARTWKLDIDPGYQGKFKPGPADAIGIVCAMGNEVRVFLWSQQVELKRGWSNSSGGFSPMATAWSRRRSAGRIGSRS